jgi:hypothetical protein
MVYPTLEQVETADREQLGRWYRHLPSPGTHALRVNFEEVLTKEAKIMDRICERFKALGMFSPELSKKIGW